MTDSKRNFCLDGVGDVTLFVRKVVKTLPVCCRGQLFAAVGDLRIELNRANPRNALFILGHLPKCLVLVAIHLESLPGSQMQIREHVAARNRRDERFLRVNVGRI